MQAVAVVVLAIKEHQLVPAGLAVAVAAALVLVLVQQVQPTPVVVVVEVAMADLVTQELTVRLVDLALLLYVT
jgi:hypothetical protein